MGCHSHQLNHYFPNIRQRTSNKLFSELKLKVYFVLANKFCNINWKQCKLRVRTRINIQRKASSGGS